MSADLDGARRMLSVLSEILGVLIVGQSAAMLWSWMTLGYEVSFLGITVGNPNLDLALLVLFGLLLGRSLLEADLRSRWIARVARVRDTVSTARPRRLLAMTVTAVLVISTVDQYLTLPIHGLQSRMSAAHSKTPELQHSTANLHVPPLIEFVASRSSPEPVVVFLESRDCRGHEASFYAYPRLLTMAPSFRTWSLAYRQLRCGMLDVGHPYPGPRPGIGPSRAFARSRGLDLVAADEQQAWTVPDRGDPTRRSVWERVSP